MTSEEALDIVNEVLEQPDNSVIFKHTFLTELKKALKQAQKQQKLLKLYKKLSDIVIYKDEFYDVRPDDCIDYYELEKVIKQIKELENENKIKL